MLGQETEKNWRSIPIFSSAENGTAGQMGGGSHTPISQTEEGRGYIPPLQEDSGSI